MNSMSGFSIFWLALILAAAPVVIYIIYKVLEMLDKDKKRESEVV